MSEVKSSAAEKEEVLVLLRQSCKQWLAAVDTADPAIVERCAEQGRWTVLQCAEHVVNSEEGMLRLWQKLAQPGTSDRAKDAPLLARLADRTRKGSAPERVVPQGRIKSMAEARERFLAARAKTIQTVEQMPAEELRDKLVPHPLIEAADGYQLFHIMAMHSARHAEQMNETARQLAGKA